MKGHDSSSHAERSYAYIHVCAPHACVYVCAHALCILMVVLRLTGQSKKEASLSYFTTLLQRCPTPVVAGSSQVEGGGRGLHQGHQ